MESNLCPSNPVGKKENVWAHEDYLRGTLSNAFTFQYSACDFNMLSKYLKFSGHFDIK